MKYNLGLPEDAKKAAAYLAELTAAGQIATINRISPSRSLNQNSYLHLLLGAFGLHFGYTREEAKLIYKELNKDLYAYEKKGRTFYRSSASLTKEQMMKTIDVFMQKSAEAGYPLPLATNQAWILQLENQIEQSGYYL